MKTNVWSYRGLLVYTRNLSGDEIAKSDFSVYIFILQLYINSYIINT